MMLSRSWTLPALALAGIGLLATSLIAGGNTNNASDLGSLPAPAVQNDNGKAQGANPGVTIQGNRQNLKARMIVPKVNNADLLNIDDEHISGRLFVKLDDAAQVQLNQQGRLQMKPGCPPQMAECLNFMNDLNVEIVPAITASRERQIAVEERARQNSGREQPNLSTFFYLKSNNAADLKMAALALNGMPDIETVSWEAKLVASTPIPIPVPEPAPGGDLGACCLFNATLDDPMGGTDCEDFFDQATCDAVGGEFKPDENCSILAVCPLTAGACCLNGDCIYVEQTPCEAAGGLFVGVGQNCQQSETLCDEPDCGVENTGNCLFANGTPFCANEDCCTEVCEIDPFCCDENLFDPNLGRGLGNWDTFCAQLAQSIPICGFSDPFPSCNVNSGPCNDLHDTPGCSDRGCCVLVCTVDPFCCQNEWDESCVTLAIDECAATGVPGTTPDLTENQGYLTPEGYGAMPPADIAVTLPQAVDEFGMAAGVLGGYTGEGYDIAGLENFAQDLLDDFGVGTVNGADGASIKIAVVEHSCFPQHEDLVGKLNVEPGQTVIFGQPSPLDGNHGTACLGIIGASDDGSAGAGPDEVGMVGMTPNAELWFFPIVSAEEGGRTLNALFSMSETFGPGDIASYSIGPSGCGTLATAGDTWALLRLLSDLGITSFLAAGNDCCNLDGIAQNAAGDADVIIVGACTPGFPHCRIGFSNFCVNCGGALDDVHVNGWGTNVATLGYGNLFTDPANDVNRRYTTTFNGTSAACPQIAALGARVQGFAQQFFDGFSLSPAQLRAVMTGSTQCASPLAQVWGAAEPVACAGDRDPGQPPNQIGLFVDPLGTGVSVATFELFDGNPFLEDVDIIEGVHVFGNSFSLDSSDDSYFVVQSEWQSGKVKGAAGSAPGKGFRYLGAGQTVDIVYTANVNFGNVEVMNVILEHTPLTAGLGEITYITAELFDWSAGRWEFVGLEQNNCPNGAPGGDVQCGAAEFTAQAAQRFINPTNRNVIIRTTFLRPGGQSTNLGGQIRGPTGFVVSIDQIVLTAIETFGFQNGGPGGMP
ncbi:MAG: S8 family serine peptidase [Planctomycetota bacterium]